MHQIAQICTYIFKNFYGDPQKWRGVKPPPQTPPIHGRTIHIILGPTKGNGTEDKIVKSQETRSQPSRQKHWLFCVSKYVSARAHEYVGLIEIMPAVKLHGVRVITKLYFVILRHLKNQ